MLILLNQLLRSMSHLQLFRRSVLTGIPSTFQRRFKPYNSNYKPLVLAEPEDVVIEFMDLGGFSEDSEAYSCDLSTVVDDYRIGIHKSIRRLEIG